MHLKRRSTPALIWAAGAAVVGAVLYAQQPAPSKEVSPVTPRGPIRLTASPPKLAAPQPAANTTAVKAQYVGSVTCQRCHAAMYERWSHTRMANVITDPKVNPSVVLGDFSKRTNW